ncbi:hypothetical protein [Pseudomonas sp. TMW22090]|nr:hypothetical protein [Pseudomonas sp. TMW22090]
MALQTRPTDEVLLTAPLERAYSGRRSDKEAVTSDINITCPATRHIT